MKKRNLLFLVVGIFVTGLVSFLLYTGSQDVSNTKTNYAKASIGIADDPAGRLEYERKMLADPATGKIPENIRAKELKFAANLPKVEDVALAKGKGINTLTWSKRGPINRGGRTRALAVDIRTNDLTHFNNSTVIVIAGGASGGIYKSIDDSIWTNKLSPNVIHSITSIAQDTRSGFEDTWYVGTGERGSNGLGGFSTLFVGDGIYKSTDNGETWTLLPSTSNGTPQSFNSVFNFVFNVAVNKTNGHVFAAASSTIQRSIDGGATWAPVRGAFANNTYSDVQITSTGVIYTTIQSGLTDAGISRSTDDGATWTTITPSGFPTTYGRNVIGIAPSNENIVYFWVYTPGQGATQTQIWKYTYISGDGTGAGGTWVNLTANLPAPTGNVAGINVQGAYNMVIKVKTDDPNFVVIGATNLYRTTDGFTTPLSATGATNWFGGYAIANNVSQYANHHPDQHAFVFGGSTISNIALSGSDGGVSFSTDVTAANVVWEDFSRGYTTSQFYAIDIDPNTSGDHVIAGGLQDNGNYITFSNNFNTDWIDWGHGADGGFAAVRKTASNEYTIYIEGQNGWLWRQTYNSAGVIQKDDLIQPSYTGQFAFVNPFILDPTNNSIMYFAQGDSVLRSNNVDTATPVWSVLTNATTGGSVTALAVSKAGPANILFVGGSNGKILKIAGANVGNPVATDISTGKGMPSGYVSSIVLNPANPNILLVAFSNYNVKSLWASGDGGATWSDISGNLEQNADGTGNGPSTRWITVSEFNVTLPTFYVATSTGLYSTNNINGTSTVWAQEGSTTIGNVVSTMVKSRNSDGYIVVGTHGMGVYSATEIITGIENEKSIPTNFTLSQNYPNPFNPSTTIAFSLPQANNVTLTLYDALGKKVRDIVNKNFSAGNHSVNFNASNLTSGVYFYRIQADNFVQTKKMILLK